MLFLSRLTSGPDRQAPHTRQTEELPDDGRAAQHEGDLEAEDGDDRAGGVLQRVLEEDDSLAGSLRAGGAYVILLEDSDHGAARVTSQLGCRCCGKGGGGKGEPEEPFSRTIGDWDEIGRAHV